MSELRTVRRCLELLPVRLRWQWALLAPLALLTGALEAGGAASVFGLIRIVGDPASVESIPVAAAVAKRLPWSEPGAVVLAFTALVALYHVARSLALIAAAYLRYRVVGESEAAVAAGMLKGYLRVPYPFHFRRNSSELIGNTGHAVRVAYSGVMDSSVAVAGEALVVAGVGAVLFSASPRVTLLAGGALAGLLVLLLRLTRRAALRLGAGGHALQASTLQSLRQALGGIKEIKALGREAFFYEAFTQRQRAALSLGYLSTTLSSIPPLVVETAFVCGALAVIALASLGGRSGPETLPLLALFAYAGFRIVPSCNRIGWRVNQIRGGSAAVDALYEDHLAIVRLTAADRGRRKAAAGVLGGIVLEDVSYTYPGSESAALSGVWLRIGRGESLGIVGATGSGKTTLVDLVVGLLPPTHGSVRAGSGGVGYVPQSIFLCDDTLRRNVAFGIPETAIDDERVRAAVRLAQLDPVVASLPQGLDTLVGERGIRLSGGERQRVGIARALYHDPEVLVFDEATSSLDGVTEAALTRAIEALRGRKTLLVVAHRLSTVRRCDRLALLIDGRLADCGRFEELEQRNPAFRRMAEAAAPVSR